MDPHPQSSLRKPFHVASNSSSSSTTSSIATVQRAASISSARSRSHPRVSISAAHDPSNVLPSPSPSKPVTSPGPRRGQERSSSISGVRESVGNLNRWSQSTTSSKGSHQRSRSFSRRISIGGGSTFTLGSGNPASTHSPTNKLTQRQPPAGANQLAPLNTQTDIPSSVHSASSPLTGTTTPSTAGILAEAIRTTVPDYFSRRWETPSQARDFSIKKSPSRSEISEFGSVSASNPAIGRRPGEGADSSPGRGHSRNRSQAAKGSGGTGSSREHNSKQPSQKAMLSKALQKANTAVLLDNAQNFEGAMHAYSEACALLQQVMLRSSGDEDKRKLEAIVSLVHLRHCKPIVTSS